MEVTRIKDPVGNGFYTIKEAEDFEYANPLKKIGELSVHRNIVLLEDGLNLRAQEDPELRELLNKKELANLFLRGLALKEWEKEKENPACVAVQSFSIPGFAFRQCGQKGFQLASQVFFPAAEKKMKADGKADGRKLLKLTPGNGFVPSGVSDNPGKQVPSFFFTFVKAKHKKS